MTVEANCFFRGVPVFCCAQSTYVFMSCLGCAGATFIFRTSAAWSGTLFTLRCTWPALRLGWVLSEVYWQCTSFQVVVMFVHHVFSVDSGFIPLCWVQEAWAWYVACSIVHVLHMYFDVPENPLIATPTILLPPDCSMRRTFSHPPPPFVFKSVLLYSAFTSV